MLSGNELGKHTVDRGLWVIDDIMNLFEYGIDCFVPVVSNPPALHDTSVVPIKEYMLLGGEDLSEGENEELEADGFSPCNVLFVIAGLPFWNKLPYMPHSPMVMPMPMPELASEKSLRSRSEGESVGMGSLAC